MEEPLLFFDEIFTIIFNNSATITSCENVMGEEKKSIKQEKHKISIRKKIVVIVLVFFWSISNC